VPSRRLIGGRGSRRGLAPTTYLRSPVHRPVDRASAAFPRAAGRLHLSRRIECSLVSIERGATLLPVSSAGRGPMKPVRAQAPRFRALPGARRRQPSPRPGSVDSPRLRGTLELSGLPGRRQEGRRRGRPPPRQQGERTFLLDTRRPARHGRGSGWSWMRRPPSARSALADHSTSSNAPGRQVLSNQGSSGPYRRRAANQPFPGTV